MSPVAVVQQWHVVRWCSDGVPVCKFLAAVFDHPEFQIFQVGPAEASLSLSASSLEMY